MKAALVSTAIFRFALVGGISSLAYSLIVSALINRTDWDAFRTSVLVFCTFIPITFFIHSRFSFRSPVKVKRNMILYAALQIMCFSIISFISSNFAAENLYIDMLLYFMTVSVAALISFVVGQKFIFREKP